MIVPAVLLGTLLITLAAVLDVLRRGEPESRTVAAYLLLFSLLFLLRVAGQVVVARRAPRFLPPMSHWNLVPYRILLPIQLVFLLVMAAIVAGLFLEAGPIAVPRPGFGGLLIAVAAVYAAAMVVRYCVRMTRRPGERWFGGAIPIVFHLVLAAFLLTWGRYHVAG